MRVMLFGATGAVGRPLVAQLRERGHDVLGTTRDPARADALRRLGAEPVVCDALDGASVRWAVLEHRPEAIVNQLTALSARVNPRRYAEWVAPTNELRRVGTRNLVEAAQVAETPRLVSQSLAFAYRPGSGLASEADPLQEDEPAMADVVGALRELEHLTLSTPGLTGTVLRYGWFYGPGTLYAAGAQLAKMARRRAFPIIGPGTGVFSFIHVEDAAGAAVAAVERTVAGTFNVVDDDPAPQQVWLPEYARALGARPPLRIPLWLARVAISRLVAEQGVHLRGASNARARRELGWEPRFRSWREGFATELG